MADTGAAADAGASSRQQGLGDSTSDRAAVVSTPPGLKPTTPSANKVGKAQGTGGSNRTHQQSGQRQPQGQRQKGGRNGPKIGETGQGFIKALKDNFGFISCPDFEDQLFFHATEVVAEPGKPDPKEAFSECLHLDDEVEFTVGQNTGKRSNAVAKQVKRLPPHTVKAQIMSEQRYMGIITRELHGGQWRREESSSGEISYKPPAAEGSGEQTPETTIEFRAQDIHGPLQRLVKGAVVEFNVVTDNQTQQRHAGHVALKANTGRPPGGDGSANLSGPAAAQQITTLHGFVKQGMKKNAGVIRCLEKEARFHFKDSQVTQPQAERLVAGAEVSFTTMLDNKGRENVLSVTLLPPGTLTDEEIFPSRMHGKVAKAAGVEGPGQSEQGVVVFLDESGVQCRARFSNDQPGEAASLSAEDEVEFTLIVDRKADVKLAKDLALICRAAERRELGQVQVLKNNFGFIRCCQRAGDIFFHYTSLAAGISQQDLAKGDDVEFTVIKDPEHGTIATGVAKAPKGSAVFETISEEQFRGVVQMRLEKSYGATSSGVIGFDEDGSPSKLTFGEADAKDGNPAMGDHVTFRIANNINAVRAAEKLGAKVSRLAGRRATQVRLLSLEGTVKLAKQGFGFIRCHFKGSDEEQSVFFHSSEVEGGLALKPGDVVTFGLFDNPKTKELNARHIVRTQEAPAVVAEEAAAESTSQGVKFTGNAAPGAKRAQPVRMARGPDGTRGFYAGRGSAMPPPIAAEPSPSGITLTGAIEIPRGKGQPPRSRKPRGQSPNGKLMPPMNGSMKSSHSRSLPSFGNLATGSRGGDSRRGEVRTGDARTGDAQARDAKPPALNPSAATFMPRTLSGSLLANRETDAGTGLSILNGTAAAVKDGAVAESNTEQHKVRRDGPNASVPATSIGNAGGNGSADTDRPSLLSLWKGD